jgi:hypothetical protein
VKPIRLTRRAIEQCAERGATATEVWYAVEQGSREPAKHGRVLCRYNFSHNGLAGESLCDKQVASVIKEEPEEIVVITVYTFFF